MTPPRGRLIAQLDTEQAQPLADLIPLINQRIKPAEPLTEADLYIRAMFILSDQVNAYGGRFPVDEHPRLAELLIDSPVLVGHRRDLLPIGRTFHAHCIEQEGRHWVKSYFYWLKSTEGAETLRDNIDAGIYRECSLGFIYGLPECSICGKDIRICPHEPMQPYPLDGTSTACHFNYRQIDRVLETSLVYRGAIPDTSITRDLAITKSSGDSPPVSITSLDDLPAAARYLITPRYEGIDLQLLNRPHGFVAARSSGEELTLPLDGLSSLLVGRNSRTARLVGFRGRERTLTPALEKFLAGDPGPVTRTTLFVYPLAESEYGSLLKPIEAMACRFMRSRFVSREELPSAIRELATRDGVEIHPLETALPARKFLYHPPQSHESASPLFRLARLVHADDWLLEFAADPPRQFVVRQFDLTRFRRSARFLADPIDPPMRIPTDQRTCLTLPVARLSCQDNAWSIITGDRTTAEIRIQPVRIHGKLRYLLSHRECSPSTRSITP